MGGVAVSNRVIARNGIGQFIRECEMAAEGTIREAVNKGARLSRELAPTGHKDDSRTIPLKSSIFPEVLSRTSGRWVATARHALPIELGAAPHIITGNLAFYWEAAGRNWIPAAAYYGIPGLQDVVNHPGNAPQPYLRPAYSAVMSEIMEIASRNYPG